MKTHTLILFILAQFSLTGLAYSSQNPEMYLKSEQKITTEHGIIGFPAGLKVEVIKIDGQNATVWAKNQSLMVRVFELSETPIVQPTPPIAVMPTVFVNAKSPNKQSAGDPDKQSTGRPDQQSASADKARTDAFQERAAAMAAKTKARAERAATIQVLKDKIARLNAEIDLVAATSKNQSKLYNPKTPEDRSRIARIEDLKRQIATCNSDMLKVMTMPVE